MNPSPHSRTPSTAALFRGGFSLLELLMAMAVFAIAAVSLAGAINLISLSVVETVEEAEWREQLRGVLLEASRDPNLEEGTRETNPNAAGLSFSIRVDRVDLQNREARTLNGLFEITVTAYRTVGSQARETLDTASTLAYTGLL